MTIPNVDITITDGALGLAPSAITDVRAIIGTCSGGTANTIYPIKDPNDAVTTLGYGPLAEAVAFQLTVGGGTIYAVKAATQTAGAASAVTATQTGDGVVAVTGNPYDAYRAKVLITTSGEAGTAKFEYSLDNGTTYSNPITVPVGSPGTYAITNTGITLTFTDGVAATSWVAGDYFTFTCVEPLSSTTYVEAAMTALLADVREWRWVHLVGNSTPYSAGTTYTFCTSMKTKIEGAETLYRYAYAVCEARDIDEGVGTSETEAAWITSLNAGLTAFESRRVMVGAGECELQSVIQQPGKGYMRRSFLWPAMAQRVRRPIHEDMGFIAQTGSLAGVSALYHNEDLVPGLDDGRFATARSIVGASGYFATHGRMMASVGSDFILNQYREVMDLTCRTSRTAFLHYLNSDVRTNADGTIDERDALAIEGYALGMIKAALASHCSNIAVSVNRLNNVQSTNQVLATVRIRPFGYAKDIDLNVGFASVQLSA